MGRPGEPDQASDVELPMRIAGAWLPMIHVALNGARAPAILDSGQTAYDLVLSSTAASRAGVVPAGTASEGRGAGGTIEVLNGLPCDLALGRLQRRARPAVLPRFPLELRWGFRVGGLLGYELLRRFVLRLDFSRMRLGLTERR